VTDTSSFPFFRFYCLQANKTYRVTQLTCHLLHEQVFPFESLASTAETDLQHVWMDMDCCHKKISPTGEYHKTNWNKSRKYNTQTLVDRETDTHLTAGTRKDKPFWILMTQATRGWQWHQVDHTQIICISLQTDNRASTSILYRPDALLDPNQQCQSTVLLLILVYRGP